MQFKLSSFLEKHDFFNGPMPTLASGSSAAVQPSESGHCRDVNPLRNLYN